MKEIIVKNEDNLKRLDVFLTSELDESRNFILKNIKSGKILVNNKTVKGGYIIKEGDKITIEDLTVDNTVKAEDIDIDILYEDDDIIVVNKKSGMVVHPGNGNHSGTLVNALMYHTDDLSDEGGSERCGIVHRIDKDTSGVLLIAKTNTAHSILGEDFKNKKIKRKYIALVHGIIDNNKGKIDAPIGRDKIDRKKMCVTDENAKSAITNFTVLERFKNATLIECVLETGRTHQIRVHMAYIGHPVLGDPLYGSKKLADSEFGQYLHAYELSFIHPRTGERLTFKVDPPVEFTKKIQELKKE